MPDTNVAPAAPTQTTNSNGMRDTLAILVLGAGAFGIFGAAWLVINPPSVNSGNNAREIFTAIVGLCGGWVSTILVFYFSRDNFVTAQNAVNTTLAQAGMTMSRAATIPIQVAMVARGSMKVVAFTDGQTEAHVFLSAITDLMKNEKVTRVPVLSETGVALYIVHDATIYRFNSENAEKGQPANPANTTLESFFAYELSSGNTIKTVVSCMAFAPADGTVEDARTALAKARGAQDVVVTKTGNAAEPVQGWMTDLDVARAAQGVAAP